VKGLLECNIYESGTPSGNGIGVSAQSTILELGSIEDVKRNALDKLIANLYHDPDSL